MSLESYSKKHAKYYDIIGEDKEYSEECDFLEHCFKNYSQTDIKSVLDLGCGTGNHLIYLAERGYEVAGLDISEDMIEIARSKKIPNSRFIVGDMSNFNFGKKFDACICMFASFGYLNENKQIENTLKCIKNHLAEGGLFIMDCWNGLAVMRELPQSRTKEKEKDGIKIIRISYPELDALKHICAVNFDIEVKQGEILDKWKEKHSVRFFFPQEIKKYLEDKNFEIIGFYNGFKPDSMVDEHVWWMTIVARLKKNF